jgi:hypothetical protein
MGAIKISPWLPSLADMEIRYEQSAHVVDVRQA